MELTRSCVNLPFRKAAAITQACCDSGLLKTVNRHPQLTKNAGIAPCTIRCLISQCHEVRKAKTRRQPLQPP
jgi:hypothetical protein